MSLHTALQFDNHIEWLQFLVKPLLLEQWGLEAEGEIWFQGMVCLALHCHMLPSLLPQLCMDTLKMGYAWPDVAPHGLAC